MTDARPGPPLHFRRRHRLSRSRDYAAVFDARVRKSAGPITVFTRPSTLGHPRLGLSIGRRAGTAVARSRLKRMLREAFRHAQHDMPGPYDLVITARPHDPLTAEEYHRLLATCVERADTVWRRRAARGADPDP